MYRLHDVDLQFVDAFARIRAGQLGLRPRTTLRYSANVGEYRRHVRDAPHADREIRGLCGRGHQAGERVIYVAPHARLDDLFETLTHEVAHALVPWRDGHTRRWLDLHCSVLGEITSPAHAERVRARAHATYAARSLTAPSSPPMR